MKLLVGTLMLLVVLAGCQSQPTPTLDKETMSALRALLDDFPDINARGGNSGWRLLHWAAHGYKTETLDELFEDMVDPAVAQALLDGNGNPVIVQALLDAGADPNVSTSWGETPLHQAARTNENPEVVRVLLDGGADPNARIIDGQQPLHFAVYYNSPAVVRALLDGGADPNARTDDGETPLDMAKAAESVQVLLDGGDDPNARTNDGRTPLDIAESLGNDAIVELLRGQ